MTKKKIKIKFSYDSPVSLSFAIITVLIFVLNSFVLKGKLTPFFTAPTAAGGAFPFKFNEIASYLRLVFFQFGYNDLSLLFADLIIILLLGQILEERYGSLIVGLMMFFSSLFSGVLNACFYNNSLFGAGSIVMMMIFLNALTSISKKKVSILSLVTIALLICREVFSKSNGLIGFLIVLAGGVCGSMFAFLASPKARAANKKSKGEKSREQILEDLDSQSPRFKSKGSDDETVVIGSIDL